MSARQSALKATARLREAQTKARALARENAALRGELRDAPERERYRVARIAHTQLARWATVAALSGARSAAVPIDELVQWFDALSPRAKETREALEREASAGVRFTTPSERS